MRQSSISVLAVAVTAALTGLVMGQTVVVYQQTPVNLLQSGAFANTNALSTTQRVADSFQVTLNSTVTELTWWGFMYSPLTNQQEVLTNLSGFEIQIYRSATPTVLPGVLGTLVHSETIPLTAVFPDPQRLTTTEFVTGAFGGPTYKFDAVLTSPVALVPQIAGQPQTYWLSVNAVLNSSAPSADVYVWMYQGIAGQFATDGLGLDPVGGNWFSASSFNLSFQIRALADADGDGLSDVDEVIHGTNPAIPDTDADGLLDGTEVDLATLGSCLDPLDADSDGDGLVDGDEVDQGLNPCSMDTDGDGLSDSIDPDPLVSLVSMDEIAVAAREVADYLNAIDVGQFDAPNANAAAGRRNSLATRLQNAAKSIEQGNMSTALSHLAGVRERIDGNPSPQDWLSDSSEQDMLLMYVDELIAVVSAN